MTNAEAKRLVEEAARRWEADPETSVVWAGEHEGRPGVRIAQQARDFTTIWFDVGDLTVGVEAYLLPAPPASREEAYRQCLARNWRSWPVYIALDPTGDLYIVGRIGFDELSEETLDRAVGAVYELVETAFASLVRVGLASREKSP